MKHRVEVRRYRRFFLHPLETAHGTWSEREGFLIRIENAEGEAGFGEVAPIPWLGSETIEEAETFLRAFAGDGERKRLGSISELPACRFGIDSAMAALREERKDFPVRRVSVAALLPAGEAAFEVFSNRIEAGFSTFKWKSGGEDLKIEQEIFRELLKKAPSETRFRLDGNAGLSRAETIEWLEFFEDHEVEFLEQPLPDEEFDEMNRMLAAFRTPIALDESVGNARAFEKAHNRGWRGLYVVKPSLFGAMREAESLLPALRPRLIFSSSFETSVGFESVLRWASRWQPEERAAGIGTGGYLSEDRLFTHPKTPVLIPGLVDLSKIWEKLS